MIPSASAIEVNMTKPSGIIPMTEDTVLVTAPEMLGEYFLLVKNINIPSGKIMTVAILMIQFIDLISSDLDFLNFFASLMSLAAYVSSPTAMTLALQVPA